MGGIGKVREIICVPFTMHDNLYISQYVFHVHVGFISLWAILTPSVESLAVRLVQRPSPVMHWKLRREETIREHCNCTRKYVIEYVVKVHPRPQATPSLSLKSLKWVWGQC